MKSLINGSVFLKAILIMLEHCCDSSLSNNVPWLPYLETDQQAVLIHGVAGFQTVKWESTVT